MKLRIVLILASLLNVILCYSSNHQHETGVKGGRSHGGIKSYGGYYHDSSNRGDFEHSHHYHQPQPQYNNFQPYGWNFNQPTRTYGKSLILLFHVSASFLRNLRFLCT